jgi:2-octaprenyl-6-methoxyphenol hydroxylase
MGKAPPAEAAAATRVDVAIVGGGMVGASLALALAATPLRVMLIEAATAEDEHQPSFDDRAIALGNGSRRILEALGTWAAIDPHASRVREIQVSDAGHFGAARLSAAEQGLPALGYVCSNRHIGAAFRAALAQRAGLLLRQPARVGEVQPGVDVARLQVQSAGAADERGQATGEQPAGGQGAGEPRAQGLRTEIVEARLVVAADGAGSRVRTAAGIGSSDEDYQQVAIVVPVQTDRPAQGIAFERFTRTGPLAVLPMAGGHYTVVWTLAPPQAAEMLALPAAHFESRLQQSFGWRIGRVLRSGARASYPLRLSRAEALHAPRTVLVGNAAQGLHPVAGQGFNLGLRDAAVLAELLAELPAAPPDLPPGNALGRCDPGDPALERYARRRAADRGGMIRFTDGLVRGFSSPRPGLALVRSLALAVFDVSPPAQRALARVSWGFGGDTPRLMRGLPLRAGP